jgi:uncharacterized protein YggU (UPF0235/DUF167 family)
MPILPAVKATRTSLRLRVVPGATRPGVVGRYGNAWKVRVTAAPEGGKANEAVVALLADALALSRRDIELTSGLGSRDKVVALTGLTAVDADARLAAAASGA